MGHGFLRAGFAVSPSLSPGKLRCLITLSCDHMQAQEALAGTQQFNQWEGGRISEPRAL